MIDILDTVDKALRAFNTRLPEVEPTRCTATRYRASACNRCVAVCPVGAIAPTPNLTVDAERCLGCGACATACPTGALDFAQSRAALRAALRAAAQSEGMAALACPHADMGAGRGVGMRVDCLGAVGAADLLGAWAEGLRSLDLVSGDCASCPLSVAVSRLQSSVEAIESLMSAMEVRAPLGVARLVAPDDASVKKAQIGPGRAPARSQGPVLTRRQLFLFLRNRSARVVSEAMSEQDTSIGSSSCHGAAAKSPRSAPEVSGRSANRT